MLILDFETRSRCDLKKHGSYLYAQHDSTQVLCIAAGFTSDGVVHDHITPDMLKHIADGGLVAAHNAEFDMQIWEYCTDYPPVALEQWYCTSAQARVNALPASLDDATRCVFGQTKKSHAGAKLIKQLCIPQEDGTFNEDPGLLKRLLRYCVQDVKATIALANGCRRMTAGELRDWQNTVRINRKGVFVDLDLAEMAQHYATAEAREINMLIREEMLRYLRRNDHLNERDKLYKVDAFSQIQRIKAFVLAVAPQLTELMTGHDEKVSLDKRARQRVMTADVEIDSTARFLIEKLHEGNLSSVSKFGNMIDRSDDDGLVQGAFSSKGLQLHNFKRDCWSVDDAQDLKRKMYNHDKLDNVMETLGKLLRPAITPEEGNSLVVGDWSGVEARCLPWLANTAGAKARLKMFRDGVDMYQVTADALGFGERQIGKVAELSLGFLGGAGAFSAMAANYGVSMSGGQMETAVQKWRAANKWAVEFGNDLERAAWKAFSAPGKVQAGESRISYSFERYADGSGGNLVAHLPSGATIQYPRAERSSGDRQEITAIKANWTPKQGEKDWPRVSLWRGLLVENVTQATCADLLRWAVDELIYEDVTPVAHVHDEIILDTADPGEDAQLLREIMEEGPDWAQGLPLEAVPQIMMRYGK